MKRNGNANFMLSTKNEEEVRSREGIRRRLLVSKEEEEELREGVDIYQSTPPPTHNSNISNSRRRKGTPHRAPLGS